MLLSSSHHFELKFHKANNRDTKLDLHCLSMSHKTDASHKWVNTNAMKCKTKLKKQFILCDNNIVTV